MSCIAAKQLCFYCRTFSMFNAENVMETLSNYFTCVLLSYYLSSSLAISFKWPKSFFLR